MDAVSRLQAIDFLQDLTPEEIGQLAGISRPQHYVAGEDIIKQGDFTDHFFVVDQGNVHFRQTDIEGFEKALGSRGPGDHFGMPMFTSQEPSEFTAEAISHALLYVISCDDFNALVQANPQILAHMPKVLEARRKLTHGFKWLTPGEIVAFTTHRHRIALLQTLLLPAGILVALLLIGGGISYYGLPSRVGIPFLGIAILVLAVLIPAVWGVLRWQDWTDDDFIVTNKRVIHAERKPFLSEARTEIPISRIQSTVIHQTTPLDAFLNVATLEVVSAGMEGSGISFDHVENAGKIAQIISKQRSLLRGRLQAEDRERFRRRISSELRHYVLQGQMEEKVVPPAPPRPQGWRARLREVRHRLFGYEFREGETITWRKHWFALALQIKYWLPALFFLLLILLAYLFVPVLSAISAGGFYAVWGVAMAIVLGNVIWQWEDWRNDIYQVTENSIVDIERLPFGFHSKETTALLINVQDAKVVRDGFLQNLLNFGNVEIAVGGGAPGLNFYNVSHPQEIQAAIFAKLEEVKKKQRERETSLQSRNMIDALIAYHRLLMQERHSEALPEPSDAPPPVQVVVAPPTPALALTSPPPAPGELPPGPVVRDRDDNMSEFPPPDAYRED